MSDMNVNREIVNPLARDAEAMAKQKAKEEAAKINRRQTMMAVGAGILTVIGLCVFGYFINK